MIELSGQTKKHPAGLLKHLAGYLEHPAEWFRQRRNPECQPQYKFRAEKLLRVSKLLNPN